MPFENTIVIFGASGDLTRRKLIPSLFNLYCKGRLPEDFRVVGVARSDWSAEEFRRRMLSGCREFGKESLDITEWEAFATQLDYLPGDVTDADAYARLQSHLAPDEAGPANRLYYLSTAPRVYTEIIGQLGEHGMLSETDGWRRVVIEKPFGRDLESAQQLNREIKKALHEHQVFRIDHYLGKETVQNILVFRFANTIFEPVWNRNYIDHVQISVAETVDVEHRAGYYENVGVVRDMFQNHLMQLLALTAMEPPASFEADALRNEKVKVFSTIRPITADGVAEHTVRGQYKGYREAEGVADKSQTATYAAMRFYIDNWRWQGVPFYLRSGKSLKEKATEIVIQFKSPPHMMFPMPSDGEITSNVIGLCLQPHEGIHLEFEAKIPDTPADMREVLMDFDYAESFGETAIPDAYERLLLDAINGDAALFTRADAHELTWGLVDPILAGWESKAAPPLSYYQPGSWGPGAANKFIAHTGHKWLRVCGEH